MEWGPKFYNAEKEKKIIFQERSDISLLYDKKFAVRPFTVKVTHSREQSKSTVKEKNVMKPYPLYPCVFRKEMLCQFFKILLKANICCGNTDFSNLITSILEKGSELDFLDKGGNGKAAIQSKYYQSVKELDVIRTTSCHVLVVEDKD